MKNFKLAVIAALALSAAVANAQQGADDHARVVASSPILQQVAVPRQVCTTEQVVVQQQGGSTGGITTGSVVGAIAGGILGNQVGGGTGKTVATAVGAVGGALVGQSLEGNTAQAAPQVQNVRNCRTETTYENRTSGYDVTYEYAGREYRTRLPYAPGATIRVRVTPVL